MEPPDNRTGTWSRSPLVLSYSGVSPDSELLDWIAEGLVAGIVLFADNAPTDDHLAAGIERIRKVAPHPIRVMVDEEGGRVRRLPKGPSSMPALRDYSRKSAEAVAKAYGRVSGRLRALGIDTLLAPVVDVGSPAAQWLHERTYSDAAEEVATMARTVIEAVQDSGIDCCAKHFPGSRGVRQDTHGGPAADATPPREWDTVDAVPFRAAIEAKVRMVMVGHQRLMAFDALRPACLSPLIVGALLRERLGFSGLVVTDDLAMEAISLSYPIEKATAAAVEAGCDLVLICGNRPLQRRAVTDFRERRTRQRDETAK